MTSSTVGRPRSAGRRDLPENLVPRHRTTGGRTVTYWYWRDPRDGKEKPLKCPDDRATAIRRATELNSLVSRETASQVVQEIAGSPQRRQAGTPFDAWAIHCLQLAEARGLAETTLRARKSLTNAAIGAFGATQLHTIATADVARLLQAYIDQGKHRTAKAMRSLLADIWREAIREGLLLANHPNPAQIAREPAAHTRRARLTLESFTAILEAAERLANTRGQWLPNSLLLAIVTGQRREDLAVAQFKRGRDWQGLWTAWVSGDSRTPPYPHINDDHLWVAQKKTGSLVKIPLALRLEAIGLSVGDVIDRCRASGIASRYLLHHTKRFGNAPLGNSIHPDTISRAFAHARAQTDLEWPGKTPPTFHEIRSLAERLYRDQGINTKALLGHKNARMTAVYNDARQAEWNEVKIR